MKCVFMIMMIITLWNIFVALVRASTPARAQGLGGKRARVRCALCSLILKPFSDAVVPVLAAAAAGAAGPLMKTGLKMDL